MNYIILYATAIISKIKPKQIRIILASSIGAIYAIIAYMSILEIYSTIILKIFLSIIGFIIHFLIFYLSSASLCLSFNLLCFSKIYSYIGIGFPIPSWYFIPFAINFAFDTC